jgi:hypothetical protein
MTFDERQKQVSVGMNALELLRTHMSILSCQPGSPHALGQWVRRITLQKAIIQLALAGAWLPTDRSLD